MLSFHAQRRILVLAAPGDRRDEDLAEIARIAAGVFDHYILRRDDNLRGRQADPVWRSNWPVAWSRKNSMLSRRSISVSPSASRQGQPPILTSSKRFRHFIDGSLALRAMTPAEFAKFVVDETEKWAKAVKFFGTKVN